MEILQYLSFAILILFGIASITVLRKKLYLGKETSVRGVLVLLSIIYVYFSKNYLYSLPLLLLSFLFSGTTFFYRIPIFSNVIIFIASNYMRFVRIGISQEKITEGEYEGIKQVMRDAGTSKENIQKTLNTIREEDEKGN